MSPNTYLLRTDTWCFNLLINTSSRLFQSLLFLTFLLVNHSLTPWPVPWRSHLPGFPDLLCLLLLLCSPLFPVSISSRPLLLWLLLCRFDSTSPSLVIALILKEFPPSREYFCCHQTEELHTCISRTFSWARTPVSFHFPHISGWIFCQFLKLNMGKNWTAPFPTKSTCPKHHTAQNTHIYVCVYTHTDTHIKSVGSQRVLSLLFCPQAPPPPWCRPPSCPAQSIVTSTSPLAVIFQYPTIKTPLCTLYPSDQKTAMAHHSQHRAWAFKPPEVVSTTSLCGPVSMNSWPEYTFFSDNFPSHFDGPALTAPMKENPHHSSPYPSFKTSILAERFPD